ncbi:glycosyl hydrolase family 18 protein [Aquimarina sp. AU119]|uniref:glycosyl hydrolase family 18 protein n=1 Tax=Aquimarina sp. AU119 TaxID=2108528 RepID=UPI000D695A21|nr:glycosyl hydrolase family 18 protein [Aquimarina sp. AU119]
MKNKLLLFILFLTIISCSNDKKEKEPANTSTTTEIPKEYITSDFRKNGIYSNLNLTTEAQWDSVNQLKHHSKPVPRHRLRKEYKTFGWHLYSSGSAYKSYNFSLLWGISYFSYQVNPETGSYKSIHQWKTTALIDSAKVHQCKVFLSVSNFGSKNNSKFLSNPKAQETLIDSLTSLLKLRDADGINIDFEGVPKKNKQAFSNFLINLSTKLHTSNPKYSISLALYAVDRNRIFDIKTINPYIDVYTLMGYDYYGSFSDQAGPISPLNSSKQWGENSVSHSIDYYLNEGVDPNNLIVGLPYYGGEWQTKTVSIPSKTDHFIKHYSYTRIKEILESNRLGIAYDTISSSAYSVFKSKEGKPKQIWFEDSLSLSHKYDWIKSKKLSGIGIWALGYDHGNTELWELLANKFGEKKE